MAELVHDDDVEVIRSDGPELTDEGGRSSGTGGSRLLPRRDPDPRQAVDAALIEQVADWRIELAGLRRALDPGSAATCHRTRCRRELPHRSPSQGAGWARGDSPTARWPDNQRSCWSSGPPAAIVTPRGAGRKSLMQLSATGRVTHRLAAGPGGSPAAGAEEWKDWAAADLADPSAQLRRITEDADLGAAQAGPTGRWAGGAPFAGLRPGAGPSIADAEDDLVTGGPHGVDGLHHLGVIEGSVSTPGPDAVCSVPPQGWWR